MVWLILLAVIAGCYLAGSFPTAYVAVKAVKGVDIRETGSGNVGASNAMRILGKTWFVIVLLVDATKGLIPVYLILNIFLAEHPYVGRFALVGALSCMIGHIYPVWIGFKGGKGVATGVGVMSALLPYSVLCAFFVFLIIVTASRMISLGSIISAGLLPVFFFLEKELPKDWEIFLFVCIAAIFVIYKHKANIKRIFEGNEAKLGDNKRSESGSGT